MPPIEFQIPDRLVKRGEIACQVRGVDVGNRPVEVVLAGVENGRRDVVSLKRVHGHGRIEWGAVLVPGHSYRFSARVVGGDAAGESRVFSTVEDGETVAIELKATGKLSVRVSPKNSIRRAAVEDAAAPLYLGNWKTLRPKTKDAVDLCADWRLPEGLYMIHTKGGGTGADGPAERRIAVVAGKEVIVWL